MQQERDAGERAVQFATKPLKAWTVIGQLGPLQGVVLHLADDVVGIRAGDVYALKQVLVCEPLDHLVELGLARDIAGAFCADGRLAQQDRNKPLQESIDSEIAKFGKT